MCILPTSLVPCYRKYSDIGSTVAHQFGGGVFRVAQWAHLINAHAVPGPGVIQGLKQVVSDYKILTQLMPYFLPNIEA